LIDQALPPLFRDRFGGSTFKKFPLAALTFKTRLVVAQAAVLLLLRGMMVLPGLRIVVAVALRRAASLDGALARVARCHSVSASQFFGKSWGRASGRGL
jgi:hypothetical protein